MGTYGMRVRLSAHKQGLSPPSPSDICDWPFQGGTPISLLINVLFVSVCFLCFCNHLHSCCFLVLVLCCLGGCLLCMLCFLHELFNDNNNNNNNNDFISSGLHNWLACQIKCRLLNFSSASIFNFHSASMSLKVCENIVWVTSSFDQGEMQSYSATHPDPSCLHMASWLCLVGQGLVNKMLFWVQMMRLWPTCSITIWRTWWTRLTWARAQRAPVGATSPSTPTSSQPRYPSMSPLPHHL